VMLHDGRERHASRLQWVAERKFVDSFGRVLDEDTTLVVVSAPTNRATASCASSYAAVLRRDLNPVPR
jgi:hypothetical protein